MARASLPGRSSILVTASSKDPEHRVFDDRAQALQVLMTAFAFGTTCGTLPVERRAVDSQICELLKELKCDQFAKSMYALTLIEISSLRVNLYPQYHCE